MALLFLPVSKTKDTHSVSLNMKLKRRSFAQGAEEEECQVIGCVEERWGGSGLLAPKQMACRKPF